MSLNQGIRLLCTSTDAKNSTAQEVLFSKPLQWKTFQATISREKFWRYDSPWSYNYSRSLSAISEWLRACWCAKSQFSPKRPKLLAWPKRLKMDQEGQKMKQEGVKIVFLVRNIHLFPNSFLEPARLLRAWQHRQRATGNCTTGRKPAQ